MTTNSKKPPTATPAAPSCEKVRGIGTFEGDRFTFKPEKKGEAVQKNIVQHGKSKIYETSGTKQRSMVAHLVVDGDTPDPAYAMSEQLRELCAKSGQAASPTWTPDSVTLVDKEGINILLDSARQEVHVSFTLPLSQYSKLSNNLLATVSKLIAHIGRNEWTIEEMWKKARGAKAAQGEGEGEGKTPAPERKETPMKLNDR